MNEITIKQLDQGFLVQKDSRPVAALTTGSDLCDWVSLWSGAEAAPILPALSPSVEQAREAIAEFHAATPPQEPQDSDPEPEATEVQDEPESAPAGSDDAMLPRSQRLVLARLQKAVAKNGNRIQIENATLAGKAGVPRGSIHYIESKLEEAGFIVVERPGTGIAPFFTVTEAGMQVAA